MEITEIRNLTTRDLYYTCVTYNGDLSIVENDEQAEELLRDIENSPICYEITNEEDFAIACEQLDFSTQVPPRKIFQFDKFKVCFSEDYGD